MEQMNIFNAYGVVLQSGSPHGAAESAYTTGRIDTLVVSYHML